MPSMEVDHKVVPLTEEENDVAAPPLSTTTKGGKSFKDKSMRSMKDIGSHMVSPGSSMLHRRQNILSFILI